MLEPNSPSAPPQKKQLDYVLIGLVTASLLLVFSLVLKPSRVSKPQSAASPAPGSIMHPFTATSMAGDRETIDYKNHDKPTVIYVVSPNCVWCARNTQNINAIAERKAEAFRFVGVSLSEEGLIEYLNLHQLNFPVFKGLTPESIQMLGLGATPQTIVISRDGQVLKNWIGAYVMESQSEIEEFFGIQLPGIAFGKTN